MTETHISAARQARGVVVGLLAALLVLIIENGVWSVVGAVLNPHFAPEIGPLGSLIVLSLADSAYFIPAFLLVGCPLLWLARGWSVTRGWVVPLVAALLVAGTVSIISATWLHDSRLNTEFITGL